MTRRKFLRYITSASLALPATVVFGNEPKAGDFPLSRLPHFHGAISYVPLKNLRAVVSGKDNFSKHLWSFKDKIGQPTNKTESGLLYVEYASGVKPLSASETDEAERGLWMLINRQLKSDRELGRIIHRIPPEVHSEYYDPAALDMIFQKTGLPKQEPPCWVTRAYMRYAIE